MKITWRQPALIVTAGLLIYSYAWSYFLNHQEDLTIYLEGSRELLEGANPYESTSGRYIYGPSLALFLSLLSKLEMPTARIIWGSLNIFVGLVIVYLISFIQKKILSVSTILCTFIFLLTSFTFRNNAGQGQAVSWVVALSLLSVIICKSQSINSGLLASIVLVPVIEIKPYLALGVVVYLALTYGIRFIFNLGLVIAAVNVIYQTYFNISYLDWMHALQIRSKSVSNGYDQSSIISILNVNWNMDAGPKLIIIGTYYLTFFYLFFIFRDKIKQNFLPFMLIAPCVLSPFLHAHDVLFAIVGLLLLFDFEKGIPRSQKIAIYFIFALNIGWTSNQLIGGLVMCVAGSLGLYLSDSGFSRSDLFAVTFTSISWVLVLHFAFKLGDYSRIEIYNLASVILAFLIFIHLVTYRPYKMSVLSPSRDNLDLDS
jgi:hypothetical protein